MNHLLGIIVLLVLIMGWWLILIAYSRTEDLVVLVMVQCVIVFIRLMRRFMHMLHDGLSPEILIALIARERWRLSAAAAA